MNETTKPPASRTAPARKRAAGKLAQAGVRKSEATRARILDAAAEIFWKKGFALTRLSDIAKKAKTQSSSIYYYFDSREAIVEEVLRVANDRTAMSVRAAVEALPPDASPRDKLTAAIRGQVSSVLSGDPYTSAHMKIFDQIPPKMREHFLIVLDENAEIWRNIFFEARQAGLLREDLDPAIVRLLLFGMMNWSIEWYRPGRFTPEDIATQAATILFEGIAKS
tara:strand:- start:6712 stop:7380 length:669 start_codon:yes stop_codon:yes gene_type:complete